MCLVYDCFMNRRIAYFITALLFFCGPLPLHATVKDLSTKQKVALLQPIEHYAMQYGEGNIKVYVFVDPKCPHSQDFISMLFDSPKMRTIYRYYIFFYELKRFNSHNLIGTIYTSSAPLQRLLEVMVGKKELNELQEFEPKINERINAVENVAEQIGVLKRPYLIIAKE